MNYLARAATALGVSLALAVGASVTATAPAASAVDTTNCVTKAEFRQAKKPMTKKRVHRIFDFSGHFVDGGAGGYVRGYRACAPRHKVFVTFNAAPGRPHRLASKRMATLFVTKPEFRKVERGMRMQRVHHIFDVRGKQTYFDGGYAGRYGWPPGQSREYRTKSTWGWVSLDFKKRNGVWRLTGKYAYWG